MLNQIKEKLEVGKAFIKGRSMLEINADPSILSIGGFCVKDKKTGLLIYFDWADNYTSILQDKEGFKVDYELRDFEHGFLSVYKNGNEPLGEEERYKCLEEMINSYNYENLEQLLANCEIEEIFYEAYIDTNESICIPIEMTSFTIGKYEFNKEQLKEYNKRVFKDNKKGFLDAIILGFERYAKENDIEIE